MEIHQDFKELFESFNAHNVEYIIVGGYALAFHGFPRFTGDVDLLVKADSGNAKRILWALDDFGFGSLDLSEKDFTLPNNIIQLGVPPVRVDIMSSITAVDWEKAQSGKVEGEYGGVRVYFLGRNELVQNKKKLNRKKDIADLETLGDN